MPLSERKKQQILDIIDNILSYHTAVFFDHPVDPVRDQVPNYFKVVKKPMDLGTIRNKIECNEYDNVASFIADVELVWSNAILFNGRNSFMHCIVRYLQAKFKDQTEFLTDDIRKDWVNQMNDLRNKVSNIISTPPIFLSQEMGMPSIRSHYSAASLNPSNSLTSIPLSSESSGSILSSYSTTNLASHPKSRQPSSKSRPSSSSSSRNRRKFGSNFSDDDGDDAETPSQHNDRKTDVIYYGDDADENDDDDDDAVVSSRWNKKSSSRSSNKKSSKSKQSSSSTKKSSSSSSSSSSKTKKSSSSTSSNAPKSNSNSDPDLTESQIEKLANDVNQLAADDDKNAEIADLLQKMEPQLSFDEEVGVEKLSMPTLKALKKLVNRLMKI